MKTKLYFTLLTLLTAILCFSETGTLKIFSEIEGFDVYLDDIYQGKDKKLIESIKPGSYYLKILKDKSAIFSEIIEIKDNLATSVLIKNTAEVQKKLLEGMTQQIKQYNDNEINIFNPPNTHWYIQMGNTVISETTFLEVIKDKEMLAKIKKDNKNKTIQNCIGIPLVIFGGAAYVMVIVKAALEEPLYPGASTSTGAVVLNIAISSLPLVTGILFISNATTSHKYVSLDYALKKAQVYNNNLKSTLGLPADF